MFFFLYFSGKFDTVASCCDSIVPIEGGGGRWGRLFKFEGDLNGNVYSFCYDFINSFP